MKCAVAQEWISVSLDEDLGAKRQARLDAHLEACPACRMLVRDLEVIVQQARKLSSPEPSPSVWPKVAAAVRESFLAAPEAGRDKKNWFAVLWTRPAWRYAAVAALFLVIGGAVIIQQKPWKTAGAATENSVEYTLAKLQEAQVYYEKAIQSLSEAVQSQESRLAPQLAEIFIRNLAALDETIQACRQVVEREPGNLTVRAYLLTAYREKVDILEELMGLERSSPLGKAETSL